MTTTLIQNADTVVAWDDSRQRHVYMRNTDLAFRDGQIVHIGGGFAAARTARSSTAAA